MSEYTLKQCKKDMIMMWTWLAKTGKSKDDYLGFLEKRRAPSTYQRFKDMIFHCPCCTYAGWEATHTHARCDRCPITWSDNEYNEEDPICVKKGNEYWAWERMGNREKYATQILELAKKIKEVTKCIQK